MPWIAARSGSLISARSQIVATSKGGDAVIVVGLIGKWLNTSDSASHYGLEVLGIPDRGGRVFREHSVAPKNGKVRRQDCIRAMAEEVRCVSVGTDF